MGVKPTDEHLKIILKKIQEKIKIQEYISEKELEDLAINIIKQGIII